MKYQYRILFFIIIVTSSCLGKKELPIKIKENIEKKTISLDKFYPLKVEFGAIGKGDKLHNIELIISKDSVQVRLRNNHNYSFGIKETEFSQDCINNLELKGKKLYYKKFIRDGDYFMLSNYFGEIKFNNVFSLGRIKDRIEPDTLGLYKYLKLYNWSLNLIESIDKVKK